MKDHRYLKLSKAEKERRIFIEEVSQDQWILRSRRKQYPAGSIFYWALQAVYGPIGSARKEAA